MAVALQCAADGLGELRFQALADVLDYPANHVPRRGLGLFRHHILHGQNRGGQIERRFDICHDLRFEEQFLKPAAFDGVFLQQDHDIFGKERPDLIQPLRHARKRPPFHRAVGRSSVGVSHSLRSISSPE